MLITISIPDSSMPFNIITLVSTVMAFLLGSMINALVRTNGSKETKDMNESERRDDDAVVRMTSTEETKNTSEGIDDKIVPGEKEEEEEEENKGNEGTKS